MTTLNSSIPGAHRRRRFARGGRVRPRIGRLFTSFMRDRHRRRGPAAGTKHPCLLLAAVLGALWLPFPSSLPAQQSSSFSDVSRVVVVGDVHGAYDELVGLLQGTGVIDEQLSWTGGETHLVSLGDLLSRGSESRKVMDLLKRLQGAAGEHGGAVHVVMGNHELMNLIGDLRFVTPAELAAYATDESDELREAAYARFVAGRSAVLPEEEARSAFDRRYPPGYFAHRLAFRPDGEYGAWLLTLPALLRIDDVAFVHGGLSEMVARTPPDALNRQVQEHLHRHFALRDRLVSAGVLPPWELDDDREIVREALLTTSDASLAALLQEFIAVHEAPELGLDSPLWYRGAAYCNPFIEEHVLEAALDALGAGRVVIGHTVTPDRRVREIFDGRVIMLDTGMLREYYNGRPAVLILTHGSAVVHYLSPEERRPPEVGWLDAYLLTEPQLVQALAQDPLEQDPDAPVHGAWQRVHVHHDGRVLEAIFRPRDRTRAAELELAAYRLDALLGLGLVPPTVPRDFEGSAGALQLLYPNAITESQRLQDDSALADWCAIDPQVQLVRAFDYLIGNRRTTDYVIFRQEFPTLKLIGHEGAFDTGPAPPVPADLALSAPLEEALAALSRDAFEAALGEWLDGQEIRALLVRRDALLARDATR
jgi:hypothetical protein